MNPQQELVKANIAKMYGTDTIEKGKKGTAGEIREWSGKKYKKQANGKWTQISESHGMTNTEHLKIANKSADIAKKKNTKSEDRADAIDIFNRHSEAASKLDDKEYDESELDDKVSNQRGKEENQARIDKHIKAMEEGATEEEADQIANGKRNADDHSGKKKDEKDMSAEDHEDKARWHDQKASISDGEEKLFHKKEAKRHLRLSETKPSNRDKK